MAELGTLAGVDAVDRVAIHELYAQASHASDDGDGELWAATFVADGVMHSPTFGVTATGHSELAEFLVMSDNTARERGEQLRHLITCITLAREPDGDVSGKAYLTIIATSERGTRFDRSVVMHDTLRLTDAGWRFVRRVAHPDKGSAITGR